jgi:hypothetical protein
MRVFDPRKSMLVDQDPLPPATGPLIRELRPSRRRTPRPGLAAYGVLIVICVALAVASIAGPALHLLMR